MPLADAVLWIWRWIADSAFLEQLYQRHRQRGFTRSLTFPVFVHLIADALLGHNGSGRQAFERARERGDLSVSIQAAYGKLRRIPPALSQALLAELTDRLRELWPAGVQHELPACLADFEVLVLDGKTVKGLHKRLKPLRGVSGGVVGGKALVAVSLRSGLAIAMQTDPDGQANEVRLVPELLPQVHCRSGPRRLWMGDRAFGYVEQAQRFGQDPDHFLVRLRSDITFESDRGRPTRQGTDAAGRRFREQWGWLSRHGQPRAVYVRYITLNLKGRDSLVLVTSLLEPTKYPARALLALYRDRWRIERVFQDVTEVFGLEHLIGSTPAASLFQLSFCLLLYNILQVLRAYVAQAQSRPIATLSSEKLFGDVRRELIAWSVLIGAAPTIQRLSDPVDAAQVRRHVRERMDEPWSARWLKAAPQKRPARPPPPSRSRPVSAQRILEKSRADARDVEGGR